MKVQHQIWYVCYITTHHLKLPYLSLANLEPTPKSKLIDDVELLDFSARFHEINSSVMVLVGFLVL